MKKYTDRDPEKFALMERISNLTKQVQGTNSLAAKAMEMNARDDCRDYVNILGRQTHHLLECVRTIENYHNEEWTAPVPILGGIAVPDHRYLISPLSGGDQAFVSAVMEAVETDVGVVPKTVARIFIYGSWTVCSGEPRYFSEAEVLVHKDLSGAYLALKHDTKNVHADDAGELMPVEGKGAKIVVAHYRST